MKKSMKKAIAMTLCAAMAFSLTACGGSGSKNTSETAAAESKEQKKRHRRRLCFLDRLPVRRI